MQNVLSHQVPDRIEISIKAFNCSPPGTSQRIDKNYKNAAEYGTNEPDLQYTETVRKATGKKHFYKSVSTFEPLKLPMTKTNIHTRGVPSPKMDKSGHTKYDFVPSRFSGWEYREVGTRDYGGV